MKTNLKDFSLTSLGKVQPRATRASFGYVLWMLVLLLGGGAFEVKAMALPSPTLCATVTEIPMPECNALMAFYYSTGGPNWTDSTTNNWNVTNTPCSWTGVSCYTIGSKHVNQIYRSGQNLAGEIPDLSALTELYSLHLENNQLNGTLPTTMVSSQLSSLYLNDNQLRGELPTWVGNLREVRLSRNHFTVPSDPLLSQINKAIEYSSNWEPNWQDTQTPYPTSSPMLTVRTVGMGKVSSTPTGIDCGTDCSESYSAGTQVTLVAQGEQGATFIGWAGTCSGTGNCQVTVNDVHSVTAQFKFDEAGCEVIYLAKGQLSEAKRLLGYLKTPIEEYLSSKGVFPTDLTELTDKFSGNYTETLSLNNTNGFYVEATMKTEAAGVSPEIAGKHLRLVWNNWSWELASPDISAYYVDSTPNYLSAVFEARQILGGLKTPVEEYLSSKGVFPTDTDLQELTDPVSWEYVANLSIVTENGWAIQATFKTFAKGVSSAMAGKTIKLTYDAANSNPWQLAPGDSNGIPSEILNSDGSILSSYPEELTVCQGGTGTGKITATTSYPQGASFIDCGESCSESFVKNTQVTLIATPNPGSVFKGWTNPSCGQPFPMKSYGACNAIFEIPKLTIATVGNGNGTVTCNGGACQSSYPAGDTVNLVATPASGFTFKGWTVDCSGTNATTTVTMNAVKNCTATFEKAELTLTPLSILTNSQMGTTPLDIKPTGSCSSWTATTKPGGNITNLLVSPTSGTGNATITISYRKSSVVSPKKGNAKVIVTATCGTATVKKTVIIR